ncbi:DnaD domain protein [Ureaplasma sp. ES3154-GEN]|uniref:DnaD domain-containing protein n=1 Tax=Ureaplasma sp. ES3154-GEN TaxID=2984844 RepID=UPI0021E8FBDF|nr:DnaD domain protein [Ureaplasma sp. ES3154-GEN]MCV3743362.1 DnaD domain protein [Ureaplasma sp. ES3154-GEN]
MNFCILKNDNLCINQAVLYDLYVPIIGLDVVAFYVFLATLTKHQQVISWIDLSTNLASSDQQINKCIAFLSEINLISVYQDEQQFYLVIKEPETPAHLFANEDFKDRFIKKTSLKHWLAKKFNYDPIDLTSQLKEASALFVNNENKTIEKPKQIKVTNTEWKRNNNISVKRNKDIFYSNQSLDNFAELLNLYTTLHPYDFLQIIFFNNIQPDETKLINQLIKDFPHNYWAINLVVDYCVYKNKIGRLNLVYITKILKTIYAQNISNLQDAIYFLRNSLTQRSFEWNISSVNSLESNSENHKLRAHTGINLAWGRELKRRN